LGVIEMNEVTEHKKKIESLKHHEHKLLSNIEKKYKYDMDVMNDCKYVMNNMLCNIESNEYSRINDIVIDQMKYTSTRNINTITSFEMELQQSKEQINKLLLQLNDTENNDKLIAMRLEESLANEKVLEERIEALLSEKQITEEQQNKYIEQIKSLEERNNNLQNTINEQNETQKTIMNDIENDNKLYIIEITNLKEQIDKLTNDNNIINSKYERNQNNMNISMNQMIRSDVEIVLNEVINVIEHNDIIEKDNKFKSKIEKRIIKLNNTISEDQVLIESLQSKITALEKDLADMKITNENLIAKVASSPQIVITSNSVTETKKNDVSIKDKPVETRNTKDITELETLKQELNNLQNKLNSISIHKTELNNVLEQQNQVKTNSKNEIKIWMKEFERENGRVPTNEEKVVVKDKFLAHKLVCK
jgi:uncharacterized coiled-coil protein SlyX